ncbi:ABC-type amino acid transport substrate-binding protein [Duganella sp. 1224]|uniref:substrate-binding periplasmic protein n=1 Tax=Duganella sp. 1224 TaxID=2587052 RepID=UPI0015CEBF98|nr:transporter substrate-binding domain-containing protein [Duganella sp. 1224]NYE60671.1 ABC-type amino acid transport substrate-binding protein [Duganella sp. 1224]
MNRNRRHLLRAALLAGLPVLPSAAHDAPLTLVVIDQMPWAGHDAAGRLRGVAIDLARQLSSLTGRPIVPRAVPYARAVAMLTSGGADLMMAIDASTRHDLPPPLASLGTEDIILLGRPGAGYARLDDLCGRKVGLLRSASFSSALRVLSCLQRYEINSYEQGLRMLRQGRLDAIAGVRATTDFAIRHLALRQDDFGPLLVAGQADIVLYLAPHAATPTLAASLRQACAQLLREKQIPALLAQYRHLPD